MKLTMEDATAGGTPTPTPTPPPAEVPPSACPASPVADGARAGDGLRGEIYGPEGGALSIAAAVPFPKVCPDGATTPGIDVSVWQGAINWTKVKAAGAQFAFVRISDGATLRDRYFDVNWAGAKAAGVIRGAYQFFRPGQSATAQANVMISAIGTLQPGDLPPVIDVEDTGGLSPSAVASSVRTWVDRVQAALGVAPIIYTGPYFWHYQVGAPASFAPNAAWIAHTGTSCPYLPAPWSRWTFWQHEISSIDGISGPVDRNRFNGSLAQLQELAGARPHPLPFSWVRNADGSYDFAVSAPPGVAKVEIRVEGYLIGTAPISGGHGTLHYVFNVARANRAIEVRGVGAGGATVGLGNGIIDSISATAAFLRQTGEHEYELGLERAPASWATVEIDVDGFVLTDLDTGLQRSPRRAVRWKFKGLGNRNIKLIARDAAGTVVDTRTRVLLVR